MAMIPQNSNQVISRAMERGDLDLSQPSIFSQEYRAAEQSLATGLFVTWLPHPSASIPASAADDIKNGSGQCCRVGDEALCRCGHSFRNHQVAALIATVSKKKNPGYIKPPLCGASSCRCKGYDYSPSFPEECGQWWLKQRRDFNLAVWRKRVRELPDEYACIGCNLKLTDHETIFETRGQRHGRSVAADESYIPLHDYRVDLAGGGAAEAQQVVVPPAGRRSTKK